MSVEPQRGPLQGRDLLLTLGSNVPANGALYCSFEGVQLVEATRTSNPSVVKCRAPTVTTAGPINITIQYMNGTYTVNAVTFDYYDCEQSNAGCEACATDERDLCGFCLDSNECRYVGDTCDNANEPNTSRECPDLISLTPAYQYFNDSEIIYITGTQFAESTLNYTCVFITTSDVNQEVTIENATWINTTMLTCPSNLTTVGDYSVEVRLRGANYTRSSLIISTYACGDPETCSECVTEEKPRCEWCISSQRCSVDIQDCQEQSLLITDADLCPAITGVAPSRYPVYVSDVTFNLTGGPFSSELVYLCQFTLDSDSSIFEQVPATYIDNGKLSCPLPDLQNPDFSVIDITIYVQKNGTSTLYSPSSASIMPYDCTTLSTCYDCTQAESPDSSVPVYCRWCSDKCSYFGSASCQESDECPTVGYYTPEKTENTGGEPIYVFSHYSDSLKDSYYCQFGSSAALVRATYLNSSSVSCAAPTFAGNGSQSVQIMLSVGGQRFNKPITVKQSLASARPWTNSFNISYYNCGGTKVPCADCIGNKSGDPLCGWCVFDGNFQGCASEYYCTNSSGSSSTSKYSRICPVGRQVNKGGGNNVTVPVAVSASIVGIILIVILVVLIIFVLLRRRKHTKKKNLNPPEYNTIIYGTWLNPFFSINRNQSAALDEFEKLILSRDTRMIAGLAIHISEPENTDQLARALVYYFCLQGKGVELMQALMRLELEALSPTSSDAATIFRKNSVPLKAFSHFATVTGTPYLWKSFAYVIDETEDIAQKEARSEPSPSARRNSEDRTSSALQLILIPTSLEVDPNKMGSLEDEQVNNLQLLLIAQKTFSAFVRGLHLLPEDLRAVIRYVKDDVERRFPGQEYSAVGALLFLRFICVALVAPHLYGLLPQPPTEQGSRYFILLSKIIQNLANGTLAGKKEGYMQSVSEFTTKNQQSLRDSLNKICDEEIISTAPRDYLPPLPDAVRENALATFANVIRSHMQATSEYCQSIQDAEFSAKLEAIFAELGDVEKHEGGKLPLGISLGRVSGRAPLLKEITH